MPSTSSRQLAAWRLLASIVVVGIGGCASTQVYAPPSGANRIVELPPVESLFLLGDGGDLTPEAAVLELLGDEVTTAVGELGFDHVAVVLLGDNLYPKGLPAGASLAEAGAPIRAQLEASRASRTYLVLGNHDWKKGEPGGRRRAAAQIAAVGAWSETEGGHAEVLPGMDCPEPAARDLGEHLRLVFLDTQWWLNSTETSSSYCSGDPKDPATLSSVGRHLRAEIESAGERPVIVLAHHPLSTAGPHGGRFGPRQHLFPLTDLHPSLVVPLPGLGSLAQLLRPLFTSQDVRSRSYRRLSGWVEETLLDRPIFAWVAGHEHALQVIAGSDRVGYRLVSGAGSAGKGRPVGRRSATLLAAARAGYLRLDLDGSGRFTVTMVVVDELGAQRHSVDLPVSGRSG